MSKIVIAIILAIAFSLSAQKIRNDIELINVSDSIYIHKTWHNFPGFGKFPSK